MDKRNWASLPDTEDAFDESFVPDSLCPDNESDFDCEEDEEDEYDCDYPALRMMLADYHGGNENELLKKTLAEYHGVDENELLQKKLLAVDKEGNLIVPDSEGEEVTHPLPKKRNLLKAEVKAKKPVKDEKKTKKRRIWMIFKLGLSRNLN